MQKATSGPVDGEPSRTQRSLGTPENRSSVAAIAAAGVVLAIIVVTSARVTRFDMSAPTQAPYAPAGADPDRSLPSSSRDADTARTSASGASDGSPEAVYGSPDSNARLERDELLRRYEIEVVDARWAAVKEGMLQRAGTSAQIMRMGAEPRNLGVDCKSSMCRVQADFARQGTAEDWVTLFLLDAGAEMPRATFNYSVNPDRSFHAEVVGYSRSTQVPQRAGATGIGPSIP